MSADYTQLPADLPVPVDDGAADGLVGRELPDLRLPATIESADLGAKLLVAYVYPLTGRPGEPLPHGWDDIPGARGCTPRSCAHPVFPPDRDAAEVLVWLRDTVESGAAG